MKKQFFYAALAIGMMSSCTSSDLPGNQAPEEQLPEEERVAIELGASPLNAVVTTKGAGFAGNTAAGDPAKWDQQPLSILMVNKVTEANQTLTKAKDERGQYIFKDLIFAAPNSSADNPSKITNASGAVKYFPLTGAFDFFGWHLDDADGGATTVDQLADGQESLSYELTIDGTQDIMVGKATLTQEQKTRLEADPVDNDAPGYTKTYARAFSSWTARRTVQPIIQFKHMLSRLDFKAVLGKDLNYTYPAIEVDPLYETTYRSDENGQKIYPDGSSGSIPNGVYVKSIKILNPKDHFTLVVADVDENKLGISGEATQNPGTTSFTLMQKPTPEEITANGNKNMVALTPVNAGYQTSATNVPVGGGIMIVPGDNSFEMEVTLMQYVLTVDPEDATVPSEVPAAKHEWKEATMTTTVKLANNAVFEAGKYYTVNITMYGFQKIEVNAQLAAWQAGADINSNPEDDNFSE